jgi:hypothetical protein
MYKLFSVAAFFCCTSIHAQLSFADKCVGQWQGMMQIFGKGILKDSVPVVFTVKKINDSTWSWRTDYRAAKMPMTKDYTLRRKDSLGHHFITDEGDGIVLKEYVYANKMYSVFETQGILLTSSYELQGKQLIFEVTSGKKLEDGAKEVASYSVTSVQRVVLRKIKKPL